MTSNSNQMLWGIDLGGTKIEGVVLKSSLQPEVLLRERIPTEGEKGYDHVLAQLKCLIEQMEGKLGHKMMHVGIGTPGVTDPLTQLLKNSNSTHLNGKPFKKDIEDLLQRKVSMANDANCFAIAEASMGIVKEKAPTAKTVFGIIMGSGVGGGLVVNGQIIEGLHGIGGEWGHNFLDDSGGDCYCGKQGCVETILSGPALQRFYTSLSGKEMSLKEIMDNKNKEEAAMQTYNRLIHFFGKGVSSIINMLDPDAIVIGGGVGNIKGLYTDGVQAVAANTFNPTLRTPILAPKLGDSAGVFGAAFLNA